MKFRIAIVFSLAFACSLLSGCGKESSPAASEKSEQTPVVRPVRYLTVDLQQVANTLELPGEIHSRYEQHYGFRVGGKIQRRLVDVGQTVATGQVLAVLDPQDVQPAIDAQAAQLAVAQSDLVLQKNELTRQRELRDKGFISGSALEHQVATTDAAQARVNAAQSQLVSVRNGLDFQTLRADQSGVVMGIDADAGSVVAPGQSVVRVAQAGAMEIAVNVPENAIASMRKASGFTVRADAVPDVSYTAHLRELAAVADPASRTFSARLTIDHPDNSIKLGMGATLQLTLGVATSLVLPHAALYTRDNTPRVWLIEANTDTVKEQVVALGATVQDGVAITSGLKPGDRVVTAGANLLLPGQKVRLLAQEQADSAARDKP